MSYVIEIRDGGIVTHTNCDPDIHNFAADVEVEIFELLEDFEARLDELES